MTKRSAHPRNRDTPLLLLALALSLATAHALAQENPAQIDAKTQPMPTSATQIAYDVVTIKPNKSDNGSWGTDFRNGVYSATNVSLKDLLQDAYDIRKDYIFGVHGPIDSAHFDVTAKIVDYDRAAFKKLTDKQQDALMIPVLADRFRLKAHIQTRMLPVYELVVVKGEPKFKPTPADSKQRSGMSVKSSQSLSSLTANGTPMPELAIVLTDMLHRTVIDKTGLTGKYDLALTWSSDDSPSTETDSAPSIFTAVQEQLGLKLQPAKGPVDTLVIDHAEMPTPN